MSRIVIAVIQARMGSTRLPGKVLMPLGGSTVLEFMLRRVLKAETLDGVVVAAPEGASDDTVAETVTRIHTFRDALSPGVHATRGSESDVLGRFYDAALFADADIIVRLTADCPLSDPEVIDAVVGDYLRGGADYVSNAHPQRTMLQGFDVEVFSREALARAHFSCRDDARREHVTQHMYLLCDGHDRYRCRAFDPTQAPRPFVAAPCKHCDGTAIVNLSVDTADDLARVRKVVDALGPDCNYANVVGYASEKGWLSP